MEFEQIIATIGLLLTIVLFFLLAENDQLIRRIILSQQKALGIRSNEKILKEAVRSRKKVLRFLFGIVIICFSIILLLGL